MKASIFEMLLGLAGVTFDRGTGSKRVVSKRNLPFGIEGLGTGDAFWDALRLGTCFASLGGWGRVLWYLEAGGRVLKRFLIPWTRFEEVWLPGTRFEEVLASGTRSQRTNLIFWLRRSGQPSTETSKCPF